MLSAPNVSISSHDTSPSRIELTAPDAVARFQNRPAASGTNAPTSVTL